MEEQVGEGIKQVISEGVVKREDLFIATKCWPDELVDPEAALQRSLKRLDLEYVDLYIIHWPAHFIFTETPLHKLWPVFESFVERGLAKNIGVSNFNL